MKTVFRKKTPTEPFRVEAGQLEGGTDAACECTIRVLAFHGAGSSPEVRRELMSWQLTFI